MNTVVGGASSASRLWFRDHIGDPTSMALLSARPDGPHLNLLSLIVVMRSDSAKLAHRWLLKGTPAPHVGTGARIDVAETDAQLLCAWHSDYDVYNATLFRILCRSEVWSAVVEMRSERQRMRLSLTLPELQASLSFTTEALSRFSHPERVSLVRI